MANNVLGSTTFNVLGNTTFNVLARTMKEGLVAIT